MQQSSLPSDLSKILNFVPGANVLLDDSGQQVKLADFGTSIRCDRYQQDNVPKGTEAFMAPEVSNIIILILVVLTL